MESGKPSHTRTSSSPARDLASFADEYRKLAIDCLKVLRVEMQLETIFHMQVCQNSIIQRHLKNDYVVKAPVTNQALWLKQEMTDREYLENQDAEEPDDFVISLTAQVTFSNSY